MNDINAAHDHVFLGIGHAQAERRTWMVIALCAIMMVAEIAGGLLFGSIALVAALGGSRHDSLISCGVTNEALKKHLAVIYRIAGVSSWEALTRVLQ